VSSVVFDSSAVLALLRNEPGADIVAGALTQSCMSTVNFAEVITKLVEWEATAQQFAMAEGLPIEKVPFDEQQALAAGHLRRSTRAAGLSLGDRACLALGLVRGAPVMTTDRAWAGLKVGVVVEVVR
jgi:ribonuclease VapC